MLGQINNDCTKKVNILSDMSTEHWNEAYPFISVALFQDSVPNLTLLDLMGVKTDTEPLLNVRNLKKFTLYLYTYVSFTEMC